MMFKTASGLATVDTIFYASGESPIGQVLVALSASGVCAILIGANKDELVADLAVRFPKANLVANEHVVRDDLAKVTRFVDRPGEGLDLPLDLRGTAFQRRVWETLRKIPIGTQRPTPSSPGRSEPQIRSVPWLLPAPPIRSHLPFLATASWAAMATWRATAGASSASANSSRRRRWREPFVHHLPCLCG